MGNTIKQKKNTREIREEQEKEARIRFNEREIAYNQSQHGCFSVYIKGCREQFELECREVNAIRGYNFISKSVNREKYT